MGYRARINSGHIGRISPRVLLARRTVSNRLVKQIKDAKRNYLVLSARFKSCPAGSIGSDFESDPDESQTKRLRAQ
jgi:hypothetical protein